MDILTSKQKASVGRIVHVYCPRLWSGPQPGIISNGPYNEGLNTEEGRVIEHGGQHVNVNVLVDAQNNPKALEFWRSRPQGNTLASIPLFDALGDGDRETVRYQTRRIDSNTDLVAWCEWPPKV